jgi:sugar phosphate isomerase/epimerase
VVAGAAAILVHGGAGLTVYVALHTDSVAELTFDDALDLAAEIGAGGVELAVGGQSSAPHLRLSELLGDAAARADLGRRLAARELRLAALNCSAWLLHPRLGDEHLGLVRDTFRLAGELGVPTVVTMSGCPGDSPRSATMNWLTYPWPPETVEISEQQWQLALELWTELAVDAAANGVTRIALELHPLQLVYNVPTLERLRGQVGPVIGANLDPSHLFWQRMDPVRVVDALGAAVHHVHLKDVELHDDEVALAGVLDSRPFADPARRAWSFRTVGAGHGEVFWRSFFGALREAGYRGALSIENEDPLQPAELGVREAAAFATRLLAGDAEVMSL